MSFQIRRSSQLSLALLVAGCGGGSGQSSGPTYPPPGPVASPAPAPVTPAAGCPMEGGGDAPDTVDGAMQLTPGDHPGCFALGDKRDTYALESPAESFMLYKLHYDGAPGAQGCFEMINAAKATASWSDRCAAAPGATKQAWALVAPGSRWFLQVHDLSGNAGSEPRAYRLKVEGIPISDADEPNGTPAEAKPLALGTPKESWMFEALNSGKGDVDVFAVDVAKAGQLAVQLDNVSTAVQFVITITDAKGKRIIEKAAPNSGASHSISAKVKPGTYHIALRNLAGAGTPPVGKDEPADYASRPYTITASVK